MIKKSIFFLIFFYTLALIQTSFLVHFQIFGITLNLILIFVILLTLFEDPKKYFSIWGAIIGGFFWDIFSTSFIGFHILILAGIVIFIKVIFKKYVRFKVRKGI